jgi:prevent-host-death family protein
MGKVRHVNIHEAKTHFSKLVDEAAAGKEIVIAEAGRPAAKLVPLAPARRARNPGVLRGGIRIAADFGAPLPQHILDSFAGWPIRQSFAARRSLGSTYSNRCVPGAMIGADATREVRSR